MKLRRALRLKEPSAREDDRFVSDAPAADPDMVVSAVSEGLVWCR